MSDEHQHHKVNYLAIFILLCVCTLISAGFDVFKSSMTKPVLITLVMAVAACKATFVLLYFMHVRFETAWKYVLLTPTMVLALALPFALAPDMAFHYYNVIVPQSYVIAEEAHHGSAHHGDGKTGIHPVTKQPEGDHPEAVHSEGEKSKTESQHSDVEKSKEGHHDSK